MRITPHVVVERRAFARRFLLRAAFSVFAIIAGSFSAFDRVHARQDQEPDAPAVQIINRESQFKAAFLFNFGHYIAWPDDDIAPATEPFVIGVVGKHDSIPHLQRVAAARKRKAGKLGVERPVVIKQFASPDKVSPVHILFVPKAIPAEAVKALAKALAEEPTLLVGEDGTFVDNGGMINLGVKDDKIYLSVSLPALSNSQLKPSAALLRLAPDIRK
jgi:hypothetical protein